MHYAHKKGYAFTSIKTEVVALSSEGLKIDGYPITQHPTVKGLLRGMFRRNSTQPKYLIFWHPLTLKRKLDVPNDSLASLHYQTTLYHLFELATEEKGNFNINRH